MASEQIKQRIEDLAKRYKTVNQKKAESEGQLKAKRKELQDLVTQIKAMGIDPKDLKKERDRLETELLELLTTFERELGEVEAAFEAFEKK
jgi:uncharacterized protein (DUF3084 family)